MNFELKINVDEQFIALCMIDTLIIFKMIEEFTNTKLNSEKRFYNNVRNIEYLSYEDLWWPLDSFLYHTEIGEMEYQGEQFKLTLYKVSEAYLKKSNFEPERQLELDTHIEELSERIFSVDDASLFTIATSFNKDELLFEGFASLEGEGGICWHSICEILLDTHKKCQNFLQ